MIGMKKYELFTKERLEDICANSTSYREVAKKLGYSPDGGSSVKAVKEMIQLYQFDISHFDATGKDKKIGTIKTPTEKYLNNEVKITSHKLRNRLLSEGYFEPVCCCCGLSEWMGNPIPLELHHKDGNKDNNSLDNLELRCPNCHYFTDTCKTKNWSTHNNESDE